MTDSGFAVPNPLLQCHLSHVPDTLQCFCRIVPAAMGRCVDIPFPVTSEDKSGEYEHSGFMHVFSRLSTSVQLSGILPQRNMPGRFVVGCKPRVCMISPANWRRLVVIPALLSYPSCLFPGSGGCHCMARNIPLSMLFYQYPLHEVGIEASMPIRHPGMLWLLHGIEFMQYLWHPEMRMLMGCSFRMKL